MADRSASASIRAAIRGSLCVSPFSTASTQTREQAIFSKGIPSLRISAHSGLLCARSNAVWPIGERAVRSLRATTMWTTFAYPLIAACIKGVKPSLSRAFRVFAKSGEPNPACAIAKGLAPSSHICSIEKDSADFPLCAQAQASDTGSNALTHADSPAAAAAIKGVRPNAARAAGFAPRSKSHSTADKEPAEAENDNKDDRSLAQSCAARSDSSSISSTSAHEGGASSMTQLDRRASTSQCCATTSKASGLSIQAIAKARRCHCMVVGWHSAAKRQTWRTPVFPLAHQSNKPRSSGVWLSALFGVVFLSFGRSLIMWARSWGRGEARAGIS